MKEPFDTLTRWIAEAEREASIPYASAACLATAESGGIDARMVIVHEWGPDGFVFTTDSRTEKARAARLESPASLVFYWGPLDRQVRVRGRLAERDEATADRLFEERPRESRVTAWISTQDASIEEPAELIRRYRRQERTFDAATPIGRPAHWLAYAVVPETIELWEARRFRLHERRRFTRRGRSWKMEFLEP